MIQAVLAVALAIEKLIPFLSKLLDAAMSAREEAKRRADEKALADADKADRTKIATFIDSAKPPPAP